jgi:hypothetical protein
MIKVPLLLAAALIVAASAISGEETGPPATSCTSCHGDEDLFGADLASIPARFHADVHGSVGLSCQDCHGGNPDPALADDMEGAMDPDHEPSPYLGVPQRAGIPAFCGRCHSDPVFMRQFGPDPRVDQEREYWTSHHGKALSAGDTRVATCIDCHGVHGIHRVTDTEAAVYPTHVAETCGTCHSDPEHMAGTTLPDGRPIPVDQQARWVQSVHARALTERGDLSAPTCNDCHGNHGAAPPGVESVAFVCGQCHGREAELFRNSPKHSGFVEHNEFLADVEGESCAGCHDPPEPQASLRSIRSFAECTTCHGNHAVIRPTMAMLGSLPETPCALCHEAPGSGRAVVDEPRVRRNYEQVKKELLEEAEAAGINGRDRFDWMVDRALALPTHIVEGSGEGGQAAQLRPEFARLFGKFRIGKTRYTFIDPVTNQERTEEVVTCNHCHSENPELADEPAGFDTAQEYVLRMQELMSATAIGERTLLAAQRGGVHVDHALAELDQAVDSQIELEVLVHTFAAGDDERFKEKHAEGMEHAEAVLELGRAGLAELSNRRKGLALALVFISLTAVGLIYRIRSLPE